MIEENPNRTQPDSPAPGFKMSEIDEGAPPEKKRRRRGCWITLAILVTLVATGAYIIFFTSIPARYLLSKASKEDGFEAEGVSGSLASGKSAVNVFRFDTGAEKMSEVHGFEINYPSFGPYQDGEFVIESLTVKNAILYLDSQNLERPPEEGETKSPEEKPKRERDPNGPRGFRMDKLEVEKVTIHVVDLGWDLEFTGGLEISNVHSASGTMDFGGLTLTGDAIRLEIPAFGSSPDKEKPTTVAGTLTFTPALSPTVLQTLPIEFALTFLKEKPVSTLISGFESRAQARSIPDSDGGLWSVEVENLTVDEFVSGWFPGRDLHLDATFHNESGLWDSLIVGHFTLGGQKWTLTPFENKPTDTLRATTEIDATQLDLSIAFTDGFGAPVLTFSSTPPLPESEIHSLLGLPATPSP